VSDTEQLAGKVALVTGGGTGIGRATALAFAARGAHVTVAGPDDDTGKAVVAEIESAGGEGLFVATDVSSSADAEGMVAATVGRFGGLDYAYNNAGIESSIAAIADVTEEEWDRVSAVNIKGVFLSMKYEIPAMLERGGGAIVNASSVLGLVGSSNGSVYATSKHAVAGLTRCAALDYAAAGIRVNATAAGTIETPMMDRVADEMGVPLDSFAGAHPIGHIGTPEHVAETVVWLCSPSAAFVTGAIIPIDGGWTAQ
jgi:NAD(P)-dependent dehydrogenase (short-subunit alcohol dehydrogenase family)